MCCGGDGDGDSDNDEVGIGRGGRMLCLFFPFRLEKVGRLFKATGGRQGARNFTVP